MKTDKRYSDPDYIDDNMLFAMFKGKYPVSLSLNNEICNRSANVLVIGGTGTGKTFKYIKPNILQENCSVVVTDPSGDIFSSFAPYLMARGYNVYLFNASDFTLSNHYNPLMNVYDADGNISEKQVDVLVDLYMKNAKAGKEAGGSDPFWDKSEKAFMTALIYYILENDEIEIKDKCFRTVLDKVQMAKIGGDEDSGEEPKSPLTLEMEEWFVKVGIARRRPDGEIEEIDKTAGGKYKTKLYYDTFLIAPQKTANTILITTAVDLQIFATQAVDNVTRTDTEHPQMNISIDTIATQQSYLFLGIPQSHQAYNFLIAMLYSQLYGRLYELGEQKLRGKFHIGYRVGTPMFDYFETREEAVEFYENIINDRMAREDFRKKARNDKKYSDVYGEFSSLFDLEERALADRLSRLSDEKRALYDEFCAEEKAYVSSHSNIVEEDYVNGTKIYNIVYKRKKPYKSSVNKEAMEMLIDNIDKMYIWGSDEYAKKPALPIHVNFLLDEFKNIGEIPNFLTILATSRKYRIGSTVVIQGLDQLKTMYKENEWGIIPDNCDTTVFLGVPDIDTEDKEYIQKALGKKTIKVKSTSSSNSGPSTTFTPTEVNLVTMDDIDSINSGFRDDCYVIVRGNRPFLCRKLLLTQHRRWGLLKKIEKKLEEQGFDLNTYFKNNQNMIKLAKN